MFFIRLRLPILIFFSGVVILLLHFFSCSQNASKHETQSQYASLDISTPYVGIEACKQCHSDKFDTYIHTGMGLSFDKASRKKSSANFLKSDLIHDKFKNLYYYPHWKNDSFMLTEFRVDKGDTIYKREEIISWIVGSGQHTNSHMINTNGYIYQAPATFYFGYIMT